MATLQEFRQKHPEYDNKSDQELSDALYKKYYSKMPRDEFNQKIGLAPQERKETGIGEDILSNLSKVPRAIGQTIMNLPGQAYESGKQIVTNPLRAAENALAGAAETGIGIFNLPQNISKYAAKKGMPNLASAFQYYPEIPNLGIEEKLGLNKQEPGDPLIRGLSGFAALGGIPKTASGILSLAGLKELGKEAAKGGLYSASQNEDPISGALTTAIMGRLTTPVVQGGKALVKGADLLRREGIGGLNPITNLARNITPEELQGNLEAAHGTDMPIGRVIQSPTLNQFFENVLQPVPFSGVKEKYVGIKNEVEKRGQNLLNSLNPNRYVGDINDVAHSLLLKASDEQEAIKSNLYKDVDRIAEEEGHNLKLPKFKETYEGMKEAIDNSPMLSTNPKLKSFLNKINGLETEKSNKIILSKAGEPTHQIKYPSIKQANSAKGDLYKAARALDKSPLPSDRNLANAHRELYHALKDDIDSSIENSGSPRLKEANTKAKENYKENYVDFLDKDIWKYTHGGKDTQAMVHEIIKPGGAKDLYKEIENFQKLIPKSERGLLGYAYLQNALDRDGNLDPKKLSSLVDKLGKRQYNALFPTKEMKDNIKNYTNLRGMSEEALNVFFNQRTGMRNTEMLAPLLQLAEAAHGGIIPALAPSLLANVAQRAMTSPKIREQIARRIEEKYKKGIKKVPNDRITQALQRALNQQNMNRANIGLRSAAYPTAIQNLQGNE